MKIKICKATTIRTDTEIRFIPYCYFMEKNLDEYICSNSYDKEASCKYAEIIDFKNR